MTATLFEPQVRGNRIYRLLDPRRRGLRLETEAFVAAAAVVVYGLAYWERAREGVTPTPTQSEFPPE